MKMKLLFAAMMLLLPGAAFAQQYQGPISAPCVVQTNLSCTPVSATNPLPTSGGSGGGTPTGTAGTPNANVVTVQGITGGTPQNIAAAALPLPTGASTSANQATQITAEQAVQANQTSGTQKTIVRAPYSAPADGSPLSTVNLIEGPNAGTGGFLAVHNFYYDPAAGTVKYQRGDDRGAFVVAKGSASLATGQVSVGTTATLIRAADTGRTSITVLVGAANGCAFGNSGVTLTTGYLLPATAGATDTTATSAALYGVCTAATTVSYKVVLP